MRILGIDPGGRYTGLAVIDIVDSNEETDDYFTIAPVRISTFDRKYNFWCVLIKTIDRLVKEVSIDVCAVEQPFGGRNFKTYGETMKTIGIIEHALEATQYIGSMVMTSVRTANKLLDINGKPTDKKKIEAANKIIYPRLVTNAHEASAIGAALVVYSKWL